MEIKEIISREFFNARFYGYVQIIFQRHFRAGVIIIIYDLLKSIVFPFA
jgi:hypothetical protein